jgi:hypothetical protein
MRIDLILMRSVEVSCAGDFDGAIACGIKRPKPFVHSRPKNRTLMRSVKGWCAGNIDVRLIMDCERLPFRPDNLVMTRRFEVWRV